MERNEMDCDKRLMVQTQPLLVWLLSLAHEGGHQVVVVSPGQPLMWGDNRSWNSKEVIVISQPI